MASKHVVTLKKHQDVILDLVSYIGQRLCQQIRVAQLARLTVCQLSPEVKSFGIRINALCTTSQGIYVKSARRKKKQSSQKSTDRLAAWKHQVKKQRAICIYHYISCGTLHSSRI